MYNAKIDLRPKNKETFFLFHTPVSISGLPEDGLTTTWQLLDDCFMPGTKLDGKRPRILIIRKSFIKFFIKI